MFRTTAFVAKCESVTKLVLALRCERKSFFTCVYPLCFVWMDQLEYLMHHACDVEVKE